MKKEYKKPNLALFPTKCHISTLSPDEPEEMDRSRRSLLMRVGMIATVGHVTLYGASDCPVGTVPCSTGCCSDDGGP